MAVIGTFGSFTAARLGIYASQSALNVTGNNISNINTKGYTRQRLDLVSLHSDGDARYQNSYNLNIGYGVLADSVSQLRDPFMDIRYRDMNSSVGSYEAMVKGLDQLVDILDEVGQGTGEFGIIEGAFNEVVQMLNNLNYRPGTEEYDTIVRSAMQSMTRYFNSYADSLAVVRENLTQDLKEDVESVNTILEQIRDLNVQIRDAGLFGDQALELRDARNVLIDELSGYMKIDVRYDMEKIDEFSSIERINISIANSGTPPIKLIQGIYGTQLEMPEMAALRNPEFDPSKPQCNKYISQESDLAKGIIKYTNNEREALRDNAGAVLNDNTAQGRLTALGYNGNALDAATFYDEANMGPYLIKNPDGTFTGTSDRNAATQVDNAMKNSEENRLWMQLKPLVDEQGRYMRDQYNQEIKETVDLSDVQLYGSLQSKRELITEEGEFASQEDIDFDENANIKRGVSYYQHALDSLAQQFAKMFNEANRLNFDQVKEAYVLVADPADPNQKVFADKDGNPFRDPDGNTISETYFDDVLQQIADVKADNTKTEKEKMDEIEALELEAYDKMELLRQSGELVPEWAFYNGGVLLSNKGDGNDPTNITAANITISKDWSTGAVRILNTKKPDTFDPRNPDKPLEHTTADDNIYHMISLMDQKLEYKAGTTVDDAKGGEDTFFKGTFQEMLANINLTLAMDKSTANGQYNSYTQKALNLENNRQSVSGVDLNDEATSMMMFQKSYSAACQLMTTLDSMLDKLINGTIR